MKSCLIEGCNGKHYCRGWCGKHYKRWQKHGDPSIVLPGGHPRRYVPGDQIGLLTVLGYDRQRGAYHCRCECGTELFPLVGSLNRGQRSCGCEWKRINAEKSRTHGHSRSGPNGQPSPTYKTWQGMRQRCGNPNHHKWKYYGALDVTVCERWQAFENFLADMGERPSGTTLDRIDPDGNYEPGNCRWADNYTQSGNRRNVKRAA